MLSMLIDIIVKSHLSADKIIAEFYRRKRYLGSHDRRWITEKVYGIIRNFILLKELRRGCPGLSEGSDAMVMFLIHEVRIAGKNAAEVTSDYSQLLDSFRLSGAVLDLEIFASGINEAASKLADDPDSIFVMNSFPNFFCELLPWKVKKDCVPIMTALNREAKVSIRVDTSKISRESTMEYFHGHGVQATPAEFSRLGIYLSKRMNLNTVELYNNGMVEIQDEASQLVGLIMDPRGGETIVDACAGAGGKSSTCVTFERVCSER